MACEEKERLGERYEATTALSASVTKIQRNMGTSPKAEFEGLSRVADEACVKSGEACLGLEQHHIAAHGC
jgi:hypothetical protein